ncbi:hypothetical protein ACSLOY_28560, partial [Klebsiella pneumoniae]
VSGQRDTVTSDRNEQVIYILKQEIEHLNTLLASKDSHIDSLNQRESILQKKELALETTLEKARKYVAGERHNTELARLEAEK